MIGNVAAWVIAIASIGVFVVAPIIGPWDDPSAAIVFGAATASFVLVVAGR